jgi:hypothetical protein
MSEGKRTSELPSTVRSLLASRGLTLADVSRLSRSAFPADKRFHVPPNLCHLLERKQFAPSLQQIFALSRFSRYRIADWLAVFGLDLNEIPRLQMVLPVRLTTLIDGSLIDQQQPTLRFEALASGAFSASLHPLSERVRLTTSRPGQPDSPGPTEAYLYAKIGSHDAFAFPDLLPGSIVRLRRLERFAVDEIPTGRGGALFLIEHANGLACSRLHALGPGRVVLLPTYLPFAQVELDLVKQARILGVVEFELRPMRTSLDASVLPNLHRFWTPSPLADTSRRLPLGMLLARARQRAGLTFREASAKSSLIARACQNWKCHCASGALSDYESHGAAPRHAWKMLSLCVLYSINPWEFMAASGLDLGEAGTEAVPPELANRASSASERGRATRSSEKSLLAELPYFFGQAAAEYFKMPRLSLRDLFSVGNSTRSFHPYLAEAAVLVIDRRQKQIRSLAHAPLWAQPLYVLIRRNGQFLCASCVPEEGQSLILRPFSDGIDRPLRLKLPAEVEVVGRVVGILRRLLPQRAPR